MDRLALSVRTDLVFGESAVNPSDQLRELFEKKLGKGPFPTADCRTAKLSDREHGILTLFLADIAGIASHGKKLASITETRKDEFKRIVSQSFQERWPETSAKITSERSPTLYLCLKDTEEARLLIMR